MSLSDVTDLLSKIFDIFKILLDPIAKVISFIIYIVVYVPGMLYGIFERLPGFVQYLFGVLFSLILIILVSKFIKFIKGFIN